jgi:ergothioneine biosynthesis protein EgtB
MPGTQAREQTQAFTSLIQDFHRVRQDSLDICAPLATEDYVIQTVPEVSPPKWHLAHTTWFFEAFILLPLRPGYRVFHTRYDALFNSYYQTLGQPFPRPQRGLLSRPTVEEILAYRQEVDAAMTEFIETADQTQQERLQFLVTLGLHHEQQHQELLYTDIKHILAFNPLRPAYDQLPESGAHSTDPLQWLELEGGIYHIGHDGQGFAYDNEGPHHRVLLEDTQIASRPVTNGEYRRFIEDGGYHQTELWLADGWKHIQDHGWAAPLYWERDGDGWAEMTLGGMRPLDEHAPVTHLSFYEAEAYARWSGHRLPSEAEWEVAARRHAPVIDGNFRESGFLQPIASGQNRFFGDVWQWTQSPYAPYPGFRPLAGSIGEYNGKFMCNQMVLRGGSCVSPRDHLRHSYRNFFYPHERWQFTGLRLAKDVS